ncbi:MAG TPA: hypothetical protein VKB93_22130 [Thermoanaerobaculia bacterium]|nr:hypothetical protein [Thermoanaerobaculia bacterium]
MSSSPGDCGANDLRVVDWTTNSCGVWPGSASAPLDGGKYTSKLERGCQLSLNGNTDLGRCIVGPDGAYVSKITYEAYDGIARDSVIYVWGRGPNGSGSLKLTFLTEGGETHDITITDEHAQCHSDKFQDTTAIVVINWTH